MSEMKEHPINSLMETTMQKIKEMVDVNTVVGTPITTSDGTTIIPVSKVTFGFASGGSDFPSKQPKDLFGGGSGAGVTVSPVAFLVVSGGNVRILPVITSGNTAEQMVNMVPEVIDKVQGFVANMKKDKKKEEASPEADGTAK